VLAEGLDSALQIVNAQGSVLYRNRALERLTGRRSGRQASLEELFAGASDTAQAYFRLSRAAERSEGRQEEIYVHPGPLGGRTGRWLNVSVRPFPNPTAGKSRRRLTLWQIDDVTRERMRESETVSGLESTLAFYDGLPQGLLALPFRFRIDQVRQAFDSSQVKLASFESTPGEFTGFRQTNVRKGGEGCKQPRQDGPRTMDLELGHILSGEARRPCEEQYERRVDCLALGINQPAQYRSAWSGYGPTKCFENESNARAGNPDYGHTGFARCR